MEKKTKHLSLHKPDKGLNELDDGLLAFVAHLGAGCGWLGLSRGEDAAGWRRRRAPPEVSGQAGEKSALRMATGRTEFILIIVYSVSEEHGRRFASD